jgi:hypothetical protein
MTFKKKTKEPFVMIERVLLRGDLFSALSAHALCLYVYMKDTLFDEDDSYRNTTPRHVAFGPRDALAYGMANGTYYRALAQLINAGIIEELESGNHGRKGIYDLTAWRMLSYPSLQEFKNVIPIRG